MNDNKIDAPVTTWPQQQFIQPTPILTHPCIQTSQRFSSVSPNMPNFKPQQIPHSSESRISQLKRIFSSPNRLMSARYMRPHYSSM